MDYVPQETGNLLYKEKSDFYRFKQEEIRCQQNDQFSGDSPSEIHAVQPQEITVHLVRLISTSRSDSRVVRLSSGGDRVYPTSNSGVALVAHA